MATKAELLKLADAAEAAVEELLSAMQENYDNRSERWQASEAGDDWRAAIDEVLDAIDSLTEAAAVFATEGSPRERRRGLATRGN